MSAVRTILVVDDTEATRYIVGRMLRDGGHRVIEAATGAEGLERVRAVPDAVVLDVRLPDISGFEVCHRIKHDPATCHVPVLLMSATETAGGKKAEGLDGGADAYLTHPVDSTELLATIRAILRAADAEAELRELVEAIPQKVWIAAPDGGRLRHNAVWGEYTGLTDQESNGDGWQQVLHPEDRPATVARWMLSVETGSPFEMAYRYRRHDGAYRWHLGRALPMRGRDERAVKWFGTCTDVDDARRALDALEATNAALADATVEARDARIAADDANQAKSEFLAMMSHELRTPLNAISGYAQLLDAEIAGPLNPKQRGYLGRMGQANTHLLALINDVLNFAKLEGGHVSFEMTTVPVATICANLDAMVAPQVAAKQLAYVCDPIDPALVVHVDAEKLLQVLINLTTNAMKFTEAGGRITVHTEADDRAVRISVRDTGHGIPADKLATIFDPFVQAHRANSTRTDGVGLGLAISRDLARAMGGDLTAESELGRGSTFTLTLPRAGRGAPVRESSVAAAKA